MTWNERDHPRRPNGTPHAGAFDDKNASGDDHDLDLDALEPPDPNTPIDMSDDGPDDVDDEDGDEPADIMASITRIIRTRIIDRNHKEGATHAR